MHYVATFRISLSSPATRGIATLSKLRSPFLRKFPPVYYLFRQEQGLSQLGMSGGKSDSQSRAQSKHHAATLEPSVAQGRNSGRGQARRQSQQKQQVRSVESKQEEFKKSGSLAARRHDSSVRVTKQASPKEALYITIGPQCSGKTTFLSRSMSSSGAGTFLDISMDGISGTYEDVPVSVVRDYQETGELHGSLLKRVHKSYLYEYIDELQGCEQLALLLFFTGDVSLQELREHLASCWGLSTEQQGLISDTAEQLLAAGVRCTSPTVAIFIQQAMGFAVKQAARDLTAAAQSHPGPVGWGNTNLHARDYKVALTAAHQAGRPVHFVLWGTAALPAVPLDELFRRNVKRFLRTGKFIPLRVMADYLRKADALVARLRNPEDAKELAQFGGYDMSEDGFVSPATRRSDKGANKSPTKAKTRASKK